MPAKDLAKFLGICLLTPSLINGLSDHHLNILLNKDTSTWSGATFKCDGSQFIIYNDSHADVRQESTIMHEIAHILCGHEPKIPLETHGINLPLRDYNAEHEAEAEWLGGCLQLPREGLIWALKNGMSVEEIAKNYHASLKMTKYRIGKSGAKIQVDRGRKYYRR